LKYKECHSEDVACIYTPKAKYHHCISPNENTFQMVLWRGLGAVLDKKKPHTMKRQRRALIKLYYWQHIEHFSTSKKLL